MVRTRFPCTSLLGLGAQVDGRGGRGPAIAPPARPARKPSAPLGGAKAGRRSRSTCVDPPPGRLEGCSGRRAARRMKANSARGRPVVSGGRGRGRAKGIGLGSPSARVRQTISNIATILRQLQRLHRDDEPHDQEQPRDRPSVCPRTGTAVSQPLAEQRRGHAGGDDPRRRARRRQRRAVEAAGEGEGARNWVRSPISAARQRMKALRGSGPQPAGSWFRPISLNSPEAAAKRRANAVIRVIARMVIAAGDIDPGQRGDDIAGERGEDPGRPSPWNGRFVPGGEHRDDQLGLVAPFAEEGGDESW